MSRKSQVRRQNVVRCRRRRLKCSKWDDSAITAETARPAHTASQSLGLVCQSDKELETSYNDTSLKLWSMLQIQHFKFVIYYYNLWEGLWNGYVKLNLFHNRHFQV